VSQPRRQLHTREEAAAAAGVEPDGVDRIWRAAGLPSADPGVPQFSDREVEILRGFAVGAALFGEESVLRFTRVMGTSLSRVAEAAIAMAVANLSGPMELAGADEATLTLAGDRANAALDLVPSIMEALFPHHVEMAIRRFALSRPEGALRTVNLAVAFLDLVGFTERSGSLTTEELAIAVADFETLAGGVIAAHDARLVKMIGDEVMYVATDAVVAAEIALDLRDAVAAHPVLAHLRGGLVFGAVVAQDGDYYGPEVNLASRIVGEAGPGEILASAAVADALAVEGQLVTAAQGERDVRGFERPVAVFAVERSSDRSQL
jgi:class 3 adenylate cyclase